MSYLCDHAIVNLTYVRFNLSPLYSLRRKLFVLFDVYKIATPQMGSQIKKYLNIKKSIKYKIIKVKIILRHLKNIYKINERKGVHLKNYKNIWHGLSSLGRYLNMV